MLFELNAVIEKIQNESIPFDRVFAGKVGRFAVASSNFNDVVDAVETAWLQQFHELRSKTYESLGVNLESDLGVDVLKTNDPETLPLLDGSELTDDIWAEGNPFQDGNFPDAVEQETKGE